METYVSYLRRKLDPLGPPMIHTQRGVGYSLRLRDGGRPVRGESRGAGGRQGPGGRAMNSSRRLSLRARMLILLIAVTAIFLLIMGAVTTAVLSKRVSNVSPPT